MNQTDGAGRQIKLQIKGEELRSRSLLLPGKMNL